MEMAGTTGGRPFRGEFRFRFAMSRPLRILLRCAVFGVLALPPLATAQVAPEVQQAQEPAASGGDGETNGGGYVIGVGDVLGISVWKNPELQVTVPVRPDGRISVPLVGDLEVVGLAPSRVQEQLQRAYEQFITAPGVSVVVTEINSRKVFILGEVLNSGVYDILQPTKLMQALAMAGGLTEWAKEDQVIVLRDEGTTQRRWRLSLKAITSGRSPEDNLLLLPGDTVIVP